MGGKARIIIVEDRFIVAEDLATSLRRLGYEVLDTIMDGQEAIERVRELQPDLVLMDIQLKGEIDGVHAAQELKDKYGLHVVYLTAHSDDATLQRASSTEPLGYLLKPYEERQLYTTIELALNRQRTNKVARARTVDEKRPAVIGSPAAAPRENLENPAVRSRDEFRHIIGNDPALIKLLAKVEMVAKTEVTVHIVGESGVGKELIADSIHRLSSRRDHPFIKLNCSAIPTTLLESALFGHLKGAFTGASRDQEGFVQRAEGGTLFLDEIGDIAPEIQVKLLRLLQVREYSRVGETSIRKADLRVITATNRDLKSLVKAGQIREDFFYRIHVFPLVVPPLRERSSDIMLLAEHFRSLFCETFSKKVPGFSAAARQALQAHVWPGNVRELENAVRHAFVVVPDNTAIDVAHLPDEVAGSVTERRGSASPGDAFKSVGASEQDERETIIRALQEARGSRSRAAEILGYSRVTLWKKMNRFGMSDL